MAEEGKEVELAIPPFFCLYKDGSFSRSPPLHPLVTPSLEPCSRFGVASKDLSVNAELGLWARLFLPRHDSSPTLPLVLYFHGGGFIFGSPAWENFHVFCANMASRSSTIWVSASYRLAPEYRFPAAFDDGFAALEWLQAQSLLQSEGKHDLMDPWLASHADFSKCFVAGESAGGTLAHRVMMRALSKPLSPASWEPLCLRGLILIHPGFTREKRTQEEMDCKQDSFMNWELADACTSLTVPSGSSRKDAYFYVNPLSEISSPENGLVHVKTLVALANNDALHFMGLEYVRLLESAGCRVQVVMSRGVGHVFFIVQPDSEQAQILMQSITSFITEG